MTVAGRWAQAPTARLRLRLARQGRAGLVLLPGLVCAVTGSVLLGGKSLGQDESVSATLARLGWHDLARVLFGREANMAVYHLLLKGWTAVFGAGESAVRSLSVLCAAGAASALFLLVARLLGRRTAVVSGILFGLNPVVLRLAQTARGYALCLLLVVAAELLLVVAVQRRSRSAWVGYAVVTACAVATNSLVVLLPAANLLALAALPRSAVRRRDLAGSTALLSLLVAPLLLRVQQANADGVGWIAAGTSGGRLVQRLNQVVPPVASLSLLAVAVLGVFAVVVQHGRSTTPRPPRFALALLVSWLVTPTVGMVALSIAYRPLLVPRYLAYCLPPLVILVAVALLRLRPAAAADGVLFYPAYGRLPFDYYRSRAPGGVELEPLHPEEARGVTGELAALGPLPIGREVVAASAGRASRLWLVVRRDQAGPSAGEQAVRRGLGDAGLVEASQRCFGRACVAEYRRPGRPAP